jgi:superfamily II DNA/RNA helicase
MEKPVKNPMLESTISPSQGLRIVHQNRQVVIVSASTGTFKEASFAIPRLSKILVP